MLNRKLKYSKIMQKCGVSSTVQMGLQQCRLLYERMGPITSIHKRSTAKCIVLIVQLWYSQNMKWIKWKYLNYLWIIYFLWKGEGVADPNNRGGFFFLSLVHVTCQLIHSRKLSEIHHVYYWQSLCKSN